MLWRIVNRGDHQAGDSVLKVLGIGDKVKTVAGMTVQDESRAMPQTAATRSRFMITDILSGGGGGGGGPADNLMRRGGGRSPSPGPRDLSLHAGPIHPDSDTDSSGHPDTSSICSNGKWLMMVMVIMNTAHFVEWFNDNYMLYLFGI